MRYPLICLLMLMHGSASFASSGVQYREPKSYGELPASVAAALAREGCRIPQGTIDGKVVASNVISGSFATKGQSDWAVLCVRDGLQYIRLFWGGSVHCPPRIDKGPVLSDAEITQGLEFDRAIDKVDRKYIVDHYEAYGGPKPPEIAHFGINYEFLEKASVVYYCHQGQWLELTGAD